MIFNCIIGHFKKMSIIDHLPVEKRIFGTADWGKLACRVSLQSHQIQNYISSILSLFQIISYFNNFGESKFFKFDQIYITRQ